MPNEKYIKVYIKSESDLPKVFKEYYMSHFKGGSSHVVSFKYFEKGLHNWWMDNIDWYLQPIEQLEQLPESQETYGEVYDKQPSERFLGEVPKDQYGYPLATSNNHVEFMQTRDLTDEEWLKLPKEEILQLYKNCYKMLNDFIKSQSHLAMPGEEEIAKEARTNKQVLKSIEGVRHFQMGAKWALSQVHGIVLRDELVKFAKYLCNVNPEYNADQYLNLSKKEER